MRGRPRRARAGRARAGRREGRRFAVPAPPAGGVPGPQQPARRGSGARAPRARARPGGLRGAPLPGAAAIASSRTCRPPKRCCAARTALRSTTTRRSCSFRSTSTRASSTTRRRDGALDHRTRTRRAARLDRAGQRAREAGPAARGRAGAARGARGAIRTTCASTARWRARCASAATRDGEIEVYREMLARQPDDHATLVALAEAQIGDEDLEGAIATFEQIEKRYPSDLRSLTRLGFLLYEARRYDEAIQRFERALGGDRRASTKWRSSWAWRSGAAAATTRRSRCFERVPAHHEHYAEARTQIAAIHERRGRYAEALAEVRAGAGLRALARPRALRRDAALEDRRLRGRRRVPRGAARRSARRRRAALQPRRHLRRGGAATTRRCATCSARSSTTPTTPTR